MNKIVSVPERYNLRRVLDRFNDNGKSATQGSWSIARGGYDMAWQLSYKRLPVLECDIDNEIEMLSTHEDFNALALANFVCEIYTDCKISNLERSDIVDYINILPKNTSFTVKAKYVGEAPDNSDLDNLKITIKKTDNYANEDEFSDELLDALNDKYGVDLTMGDLELKSVKAEKTHIDKELIR